MFQGLEEEEVENEDSFVQRLGYIKTRIMDYQIKSHHTLEGMNGQESP